MNLSDRTYRLLSAAVILIFLLAALLTLSDYGMGWDEQVRWRSGDLKLEYYQALFSDDWKDLKDLMAGDRYPGLFDLPLALFHSTFGGNRMLQGHIFSILFGVLGLFSINRLAGTVFDSRTAFFSTLLLSLFPLFYGHAMMNPKDIPFMATYTLGLASVLGIAKKYVDGERTKWTDFVLCGLAIGLAASSRVPGFVLLPLGAASWIGMLLLKRKFQLAKLKDLREIYPVLSGIVITGITAFFVLMLFFPRAQLQLFSSLSSVASELHTSADALPLIFNGRIMDAREGPIYYAPLFLLLSTPLWMVFLFIWGASGTLLKNMNAFQRQHPETLLRLLFLFMTAFPWIYILISHPALHDGARHMLFGIPPLVVLMACGLTFLHDFSQGQSRWIRCSLLVIFIGCLGFQAITLIRMHPYQYVSFNLLAGNRHTIPNRFETEYWCTSSKHLLEALPSVVDRNGNRNPIANPVRIRISGALDSATPFVPDGFIIVNSFAAAEYYLANTYCRSDLLADGEVIFQIERGGIPIAVIKKLHP